MSPTYTKVFWHSLLLSSLVYKRLFQYCVNWKLMIQQGKRQTCLDSLESLHRERKMANQEQPPFSQTLGLTDFSLLWERYSQIDIVRTPNSHNQSHCQHVSLLSAPGQFILTCISANKIGCLLWAVNIQSPIIALSHSTGFIISLKAGSEIQSPLDPTRNLRDT